MTPTSSGLIYRFKKLADQVLGSEGSLDSRTSGLKTSISLNAKRMDAMETRLAQTEKRMRAQYQALDTQMAKLNGIGSYVSTQLDAMSK